ncbi:FAD/NAD(P)-binding domain-containing protein [Pluteus cervinus]|uniref:FAD/NAD(P)-binding domain-containing protein n=1 Tax=Pluteus cervinus TaxID=181527 RepID=A0ACD3AFV3_9AGAR|nr:FAD/NAD(P)-binding domain-containing protein [Pluteus cervinus]
MASSSSTKNIVIIGAGFAGLATFNALSPKLAPKKYDDTNLILITSRPFFTHLPATLRMLVTAEGKLEEQVLMPFPEKPKGKGEIITGTVVRIQPASSSGDEANPTTVGGLVVLEDGKEIPYSILVLATGTTWSGMLNFANSKEEITQHANEWREKFSEAKSIVLAGGGAVGVELAGEIKDYWPDKSVTIVNGQNLLFTDVYPDKWRKAVADQLKQINVELVLEDHIDNAEIHDGQVETRKGKKISTDLVVPTWGGKANTQLVADSFGAETLTKQGLVEVEKTLQVRNHPRVFAVGDIISWSEQKQAAKCGAHATTVATNILSLVDEKVAATEYKGSMEAILVSLGKNRGSAFLNTLWGVVLGSWFVKAVKSKGLMIEMMRGQYGLGKW